MRTDLAARLVSCAAALTICLAGACGTPTSQATIYIDSSRIPASMQEDYESFVVNCSKCHELARPLNANVTEPEHWDLYVARMMRTAGSAINPKEGPKIIRFLHWYTLHYDEKARKETFEEESDATEPVSAPETEATSGSVDAPPSTEPPKPAEAPSAPAPTATPSAEEETQ